MRYNNNKLLEGINPIEIVKIADEILKSGMTFLIDTHIHEDGYDFAEELSIFESEEGNWIVDDAFSGGCQECAWNHYKEEFNELYDAIVYALGLIIEDY